MIQGRIKDEVNIKESGKGIKTQKVLAVQEQEMKGLIKRHS